MSDATQAAFRPAPRFARLKPGTKTILAVSIAIYAVVSWLILKGADATPRFHLDLTPLLTIALALKVHIASAVSTFAIGLILLSKLPKGTQIHRRLGWLWVLCMASTAISSFFLVGLNGNQFSWIHGLSAWTIIILPFAVVAARRHNVKSHARHMRGMFLGGMLIAGLFTFLPGRLMWSLFFTI